MINYIVEIGYRQFIFNNMTEAGVFADTAFYHIHEDDRYNNDITIRIKEVSEDDTESD